MSADSGKRLMVSDMSSDLVGRQVTVRTGVLVGQDFRYFQWLDPAVVFTVEHVFSCDPSRLRVQLTAPGYGDRSDPDAYGNGALHAYWDDCMPIANGEVLVSQDPVAACHEDANQLATVRERLDRIIADATALRAFLDAHSGYGR